METNSAIDRSETGTIDHEQIAKLVGHQVVATGLDGRTLVTVRGELYSYDLDVQSNGRGAVIMTQRAKVETSDGECVMITGFDDKRDQDRIYVRVA